MAYGYRKKRQARSKRSGSRKNPAIKRTRRGWVYKNSGKKVNG